MTTKEQRETTVMRVTIMYRSNWFGGDGWTYRPVTVEIANICPTCGGPRGKPVTIRQCEDGQWFSLDQWTNPCGHIDRYKDVYVESQQASDETVDAIERFLRVA